MKQQIAYAVLAALTLAAPAVAEPMRPAQNAAPGVLPPYEIVTIIRSTGLDPLGRPMRRGPHYVLYAVGDDDREVRVLVNARSGKIIKVTPVETASRLPPEAIVEPYGPPRYIPPGPPVIYEPEPPVVYEGEPPVVYAPRPSADVPDVPPPARYGAPPRVIAAMPPDRPDVVSSVPEPRVITAIEPGRAGLLPPPPERFPQRVSPAAAAKPKPAKRAVAALPKQPPLPKPRPGGSAGVAPSAPKPESKSAVEQLPN